MRLFKSKIIVFIILFSILGLDNNLFSQIHCGTAAYVTVNGNCVTKNLVTTGNSFEQPNPTGTSCSPSPALATARDVWAKFTAIAPTATITGAVASSSNIAIVIYSSPCNTTVVPTPTLINTGELGCANANNTNSAQTETVTLNSLTVGQDYFIRIIHTNAAALAISLCVTSNPLNDNPSGAGSTSNYSLTTPSSSCSYLAANTRGATKTTCGSLAAPSCTTYGASSVDTWYSVTVPASGNLFLQTLAGTMTQAGMAAYTGTPCSSLAELGCSEGNPEGSSTNMPSLYLTGQTPSSTVFIRVWNKNGFAPGTFSLCATTLGPCGNVATNDFCSNPLAIYTSGATNTMVAIGYTGTPVYTPDAPGNFNSNICSGVTVANSWYSFVPTTSVVSIPVRTSAGCSIEVELFSVAPNLYGCCKSFTPVSSSYSLCTGTYSFAASGTGTVTASSLTVGATYYMQVNYLGGTACSFSVTGWANTGVLPIDMVSFIGNNEGKHNVLEWVTSTEKNIDSYILERSKEGIVFEEVASLKSKGTMSYSNNRYTVIDDNPFEDETYYRIKIKEINGTEKYTNTISINLQSKYDNIYNIHPNPTNSNLYFEYYTKYSNFISIELLGYAGNTVFKMDQHLQEGKNYISLPMSELKNSIYILKVVSEKSGKTTHHKIIKN